jgi:hypothetical protein
MGPEGWVGRWWVEGRLGGRIEKERKKAEVRKARKREDFYSGGRAACTKGHTTSGQVSESLQSRIVMLRFLNQGG